MTVEAGVAFGLFLVLVFVIGLWATRPRVPKKIRLSPEMSLPPNQYLSSSPNPIRVPADSLYTPPAKCYSKDSSEEAD
jgi:hypothetical protein